MAFEGGGQSSGGAKAGCRLRTVEQQAMDVMPGREEAQGKFSLVWNATLGLARLLPC